jgi:hypothetical protein
LDALWEKRKGAIAQGVQIIDSRRLPLFICTESAEEPIYVRLQRMDAMVSTVWTDTGSGSGLPKSGALTAYILLITRDLCELKFPSVRGIPFLEVHPYGDIPAGAVRAPTIAD